MSFSLRMKLINPGSQATKTVIYGGTIFEVLDPYSGVQNLAVVRDTVVVIPPGESQVIDVPAFCLNQQFAPPQNTPMRPTSLTLSDSFNSQTALWENFRKRR